MYIPPMMECMSLPTAYSPATGWSCSPSTGAVVSVVMASHLLGLPEVLRETAAAQKDMGVRSLTRTPGTRFTTLVPHLPISVEVVNFARETLAILQLVSVASA